MNWDRFLRQTDAAIPTACLMTLPLRLLQQLTEEKREKTGPWMTILR